MTVKCTSKASYLETKESGQEMSQEDKIFEIISIGGDWSLQEIMAAYRAKYSNIELSSVSARCKLLKGDELLGIEAKIFEVLTRKCSISGKTINALSAKKRESLGVWQAYVEKGKSKQERNLRLNAAPKEMREQIISHVTTCFKLRAVK